MYEFWYDYVKPKCDGKAKMCHIDRAIQTFSLYT